MDTRDRCEVTYNKSVIINLQPRGSFTAKFTMKYQYISFIICHVVLPWVKVGDIFPKQIFFCIYILSALQANITP